jgi:hypothetical protein
VTLGSRAAAVVVVIGAEHGCRVSFKRTFNVLEKNTNDRYEDGDRLIGEREGGVESPALYTIRKNLFKSLIACVNHAA